MARDDDELAEAIADLSRTLRDLRHELEGRRGPRLRPPTPGELARTADEVAIPAMIGLLEANVRALEAFQRTLRLFRRQRDVRDRADATTDPTRERASTLRRTTLDQLEDVLADLQRAVSAGDAPRDPRIGELLADARELRDDVDRRVADLANDRRLSSPRDADGTSATRIEIEIEDEDEPDDARGDDVDVDAELETLRDRYATDRDDRVDGDEDDRADSDENDSDRRDGDDGSDSASSADAP